MGVNGRWLGAVALALCAMTAGCGGDDENRQPLTVEITDAGYEPSTLEVEVGDRVKFVNRSDRPGSAKDDPLGRIEVSPQPGTTKHDGSEVAHATRHGFATHSLFRGEHQFVVFEVPKTYSYQSAFYPNLKGTIKVVAKDSSP
jgi:plastocyanin